MAVSMSYKFMLENVCVVNRKCNLEKKKKKKRNRKEKKVKKKKKKKKKRETEKKRKKSEKKKETCKTCYRIWSADVFLFDKV